MRCAHDGYDEDVSIRVFSFVGGLGRGERNYGMASKFRGLWRVSHSRQWFAWLLFPIEKSTYSYTYPNNTTTSRYIGHYTCPRIPTGRSGRDSILVLNE